MSAVQPDAQEVSEPSLDDAVIVLDVVPASGGPCVVSAPLGAGIPEVVVSSFASVASPEPVGTGLVRTSVDATPLVSSLSVPEIEGSAPMGA